MSIPRAAISVATKICVFAASAIVYVPGMAWLAVATGAPLSSLLGMGLVPFLVGDLLKSLLASVIPTRLGRRS